MTVLVGGSDTGLRPGAAPATSAWVEEALADLAALRTGVGRGWLRVRRPAPTAAFSRRDVLSPGYRRAAEVAGEHGFAPLVRPVGGHLAIHHDGAIVVDVLGRHPDPGRDLQGRFREFGAALVTALGTLGVDARVGQVPSEYCPGAHSVNARGRVKLAGTAQRQTRGAYWLSAVIVVSDPDPVRAALSATYPHLGLAFDPASFGSVAEEVPGATCQDVSEALLRTLAEVLPLGVPQPPREPAELARVPLSRCWETAA